MTSSKITAVVIAKNEEQMIGPCLDSLSFVDKILVIDNSSTDATAALAKKKGASVITADLTSFAQLREVALAKITSGYVFYLDADERVTSELQQELREVVLNKNSCAAYKVPRKNFYLGQHEWPTVEHLERFFKRTALKGWKGDLHESPVVEGEIGVLHHPLLHYTHRDFTSMVDKTNKWSETEALLRLHAHHPKITWWRFPRVMASAFINSYITQQGWRVGLPGLLESMFQAFSMFITYAKLWEYQQKEQK